MLGYASGVPLLLGVVAFTQRARGRRERPIGLREVLGSRHILSRRSQVRLGMRRDRYTAPAPPLIDKTIRMLSHAIQRLRRQYRVPVAAGMSLSNARSSESNRSSTARAFSARCSGFPVPGIGMDTAPV